MQLTKEDYKRLFLPSKKEIWIIAILVLIVFLVFEANLIYLKATQNTIFSDTRLQENFYDQVTAVFGQNSVTNIISLVVFWSGVGLVSYSIIWSIYSFFSEAKNEVVVRGEYVNQISKHQKLQRDLVQAGLLAGIVALGLLSLNVTVPFFISLWTSGILAIPAEIVLGIAEIIGGFVGLAINFYLFKVLIDWIIVLE